MNFSKLIHFLFFSFFFLMLVVPTTFQIERGLFLLIIISALAIYNIKGGWCIYIDILLLSVVSISVSLFLMFRGMMGGGAGALRVGTVYVLWPLLFMYFIGSVRGDGNVAGFIKTIIIAAFSSSIMGIYLVAEFLGVGVPGGVEFLKSQGGSVGIYDGFIEYSLYNMSTLIYAFPFLVALLFMPGRLNYLTGYWRAIAWAAFALTIITMAISGRRMFWLIAMLSPFIVGALFVVGRMPIRVLVTRSLVIFGLLLSVLLAVAVTFGIKFERVEEAFVGGFDFSSKGDESARLRGAQFVDLMTGWMEHPLLGAGHGMPAPHVIRSVEQPWAYELTYVALLYQTGLLGILVYGLAVGWTFLRGIELVRRNPQAAGLILPLLAGMTGFLISNATNPYLAKFDYLWTIFLPVAAINAYLVSRRSSISSSSTGMPATSSASACNR